MLKDSTKSIYDSIIRILSDPIGSKYPSDLLPISEVGTWWVPFVLRYDRTKKRANETHIGLAPDYS
jgi:hypothetical protein